MWLPVGQGRCWFPRLRGFSPVDVGPLPRHERRGTGQMTFFRVDTRTADSIPLLQCDLFDLPFICDARTTGCAQGAEISISKARNAGTKTILDIEDACLLVHQRIVHIRCEPRLQHKNLQRKSPSQLRKENMSTEVALKRWPTATTPASRRPCATPASRSSPDQTATPTPTTGQSIETGPAKVLRLHRRSGARNCHPPCWSMPDLRLLSRRGFHFVTSAPVTLGFPVERRAVDLLWRADGGKRQRSWE